MKNNLKQILITAIILIPLAFSARAYNAPTASDKAGNTDVVPIYLNATPQVKNGDLALGGTFFVQGNALFNQNLYLKGIIMGALPVAGSSATASTVNLGSSANHSSAVVYGETTTATKFQSDSLIHTGGLKPICADVNGKIILCGTSVVTPPVTSPTVSSVTVTGGYNPYTITVNLDTPATVVGDVQVLVDLWFGTGYDQQVQWAVPFAVGQKTATLQKSYTGTLNWTKPPSFNCVDPFNTDYQISQSLICQ